MSTGVWLTKHCVYDKQCKSDCGFDRCTATFLSNSGFLIVTGKVIQKSLKQNHKLPTFRFNLNLFSYLRIESSIEDEYKIRSQNRTCSTVVWPQQVYLIIVYVIPSFLAHNTDIAEIVRKPVCACLRTSYLMHNPLVIYAKSTAIIMKMPWRHYLGEYSQTWKWQVFF